MRTFHWRAVPPEGRHDRYRTVRDLADDDDWNTDYVVMLLGAMSRWVLAWPHGRE